MPKRSAPANDPSIPSPGVTRSYVHTGPDESLKTSMPVLITPALFSTVLTARDPQGHKGTFGSAAILGGAPGMTGAALLAGRSALKAGAGRVYVCLAQDNPEIVVDYVQPELMLRPAHEMLSNDFQASAWGAGCGMGTSCEAIDMFRALLSVRGATPIVIDADALNALASSMVQPDWVDTAVVLTPHPAEAARLLQTTTAHVQANRAQAARKLSTLYRAWIVLKGHQSLVAAPNGDMFINPTGHVALATAGTGDVLTGMITSLLAQGYETKVATLAGVWLHGAAGEVMAHKLGGPIGVTASEIIESIRVLRNTSTALEQEISQFGISRDLSI